MSNKLVHGIIGLFGGLNSTIFGKEIIVFIISLMPILELRGGLLAASLLGLDPLPSYIISIIGNILPIPLILWFMNSILNWMRKCKYKKINSVAKWLDKKLLNIKVKLKNMDFGV